MHIKEENLKQILLDSGLIDEAAWKSAKDEADNAGQSVESVLISRELITDDYLTELLEPYFGVPLVNLKKLSISQETINLLPENFAKSNGVVLFDIDKPSGIAKLAMRDPLDLDTIEFVRLKLDSWIKPHLASQSSIIFGLRQYKKQGGQSFSQIIEQSLKEANALAGDTDVGKKAEAVPIITILDSVLENAAVSGASDIHFEPMAKKFLVRYRVDGVMQEILSLPKAIAPVLVARVKILSGMQIDEHRTPQDGRFRFELENGAKVDVRVNCMPILNGEKVEMRLLKSSTKPLSLGELGFSEGDIATITDEIKKTHGMILVTGPTGHGKTTTLYSILHILNTPKVNITTIEDPIEYEVARLNQTQVNAKAGITFANGLRALLRQNPDIIMIGEIRDNETVDIAIHSALTGHLVLSTIHTNDAPSAIPRLADMGAENFLLASTLNLVIAQRLVRRICISCIESHKPSNTVKKMITDQLISLHGKKIDKEMIPDSIFRGKGCKVCGGSGFTGQVGIYEVLKVSEDIRKLITDKGSLDDVRKEAISQGMITMFEDGLKKVEQGVTTIEEILRVVRE
ncbi:type II/IV secretion system protein [Candidatus Falkowbacteria bacterium]|nr:type II/IV secretion system protein [Candidatus Falkowbacteria bacterium]